MNDLLLICLIALALYYFYVNSNKKPNNSMEKSTQTNPKLSPDPELENTLDKLITEIKQLTNQLN